MAPSLVRPEIKRGPVFDYGPFVRITPDHLESGVSVLVVAEDGAPLPPGTICLYLGHGCRLVVVGVESERRGIEAVVVEAHLLDVFVPDPDPLCPEWMEFREGYELGEWEALSERGTGVRLQGRAPTWFGRGVVAGAKARLEGKSSKDWEADRAAYKEILRRLHPRDWPAPLPWETRRVA
ncbi:MAG: hypothetical protein ACO1SV_27550 [Fimbriimonas sp.]